MRLIGIFGFTLLILSMDTNGQYNDGIFMHGAINPFGIQYDQSALKINDYVTSNYSEISSFSYVFGGNIKLMQTGKDFTAGFSGGFTIGKSIDSKNFAEMSSAKWNLGLVWYPSKKKGYKGLQTCAYFSWGQRDYFFSDNVLNIPTSQLANFSNSTSDNIRFDQKSLGVSFDLGLNQNSSSQSRAGYSKSHYRFLVNFEYFLKSSSWKLNEQSIPEYGDSGFFSTLLLFQVDFGKCMPHLMD
jgi:hypothetical protein